MRTYLFFEGYWIKAYDNKHYYRISSISKWRKLIVFLHPYKIYSLTIRSSLAKKRFHSCLRERSILNFSYSNFTIMIFLGSMRNLDFSRISLKNGIEKSIKMSYHHSQIHFTRRIFSSTIPSKTLSYIIIKTLLRSLLIFSNGSIKHEIQLCVCFQRKRKKLVFLLMNSGK